MSQIQKSLMPKIGVYLAYLYSEGRDAEKTIHIWYLENCSRDGVTADYLIQLSHNLNLFKTFEYTIEVLEGSMDMMETFEEEEQAETKLIRAYIGCGEFLKTKAAHKKRSTGINRWAA